MKKFKLWVEITRTAEDETKVIGKIGWTGGKNYEARPEDKESEWIIKWYEKAKEGNSWLKHALAKAEVPYEYLYAWSEAYSGSYFSISKPIEESFFDVPRR